GAVPSKSLPTAGASDGQLIGSLPAGLTLPNRTSATAVPASVLPWYAISTAFAFSAEPSPTGRPAMTTTITGLPVASSAVMRACWSGASAGAGLSPRPSAYAFSPTATTYALVDGAAATALAWSGAKTAAGSAALMPLSTVAPGGIWLAGPMQHTCPAPNTPCQLTLQPPSWLVIESALGPVTTTLAPAGSGNALFSLRSNVIDCCAALSVWSRPAVTAALAAFASTHGLLGSATHGWSNRPSWNFSVRIRRTAWSIRAREILPVLTSCRIAACQPAESKTCMLMSTPALTAA